MSLPEASRILILAYLGRAAENIHEKISLRQQKQHLRAYLENIGEKNKKNIVISQDLTKQA